MIVSLAASSPAGVFEPLRLPGSPEVWRAIARRIAPAALPDEASEQAFLDVVGSALADRRELARPLEAFLGLVRWLPVLRYGSRFESLAPAQQDAVLHWFERSPLAAIRTGFAGVRTLVLMGHYGRPEMGPTLGYAPSREGNERLHA